MKRSEAIRSEPDDGTAEDDANGTAFWYATVPGIAWFVPMRYVSVRYVDVGRMPSVPYDLDGDD